MDKKRKYIAIDLKSFYASVECVERGLDPLDVCLVVADPTRTQKTICLAVSPALKAFGTGGRPRLFEVVSRIRDVNRERASQCSLIGRSTSGRDLARRRDLAVDFLVAPPRMALYLDYSRRVYNVYLRYIAPEDIHVYSVDEVFIDVTPYLSTYRLSTRELAVRMIRDVLAETGVTATAGVGTNLYLAKIAMDIMAKKKKPDKDGVRIAELDEMSYRRQLWDHTPLTDFWRVGAGTARRLLPYGIATMGDIARFSLAHENLLYKLLGVNAELLIDHAWGWEPVGIAQIKAYRPETRSICSGQVLTCAYTAAKARIVALEMADSLSLELIEKRLVTDQLVLQVGYDVESLTNPEIRSKYSGPIKLDHYGRPVPVHAHGSGSFERPTSSGERLISKIAELFDRIVNPDLLVRRLTITASRVRRELSLADAIPVVEPDLFNDYETVRREYESSFEDLSKERRKQEAVVRIRKRYGKNAMLKGLNFADGATQRQRNSQIGGHSA